jgi:SAM-dependent methyltransferase
VTDHSDQIYYRDGGRFWLARRISHAARLRIYQDFLREMAPSSSSTILDIGTSNAPSEEANILEANYPYPQNITCGTIGDDNYIATAHPHVKVVKITPGEPLPFRDQEFDIVYSNAVLEHVGGAQERRLYLLENLRVAKRIFVAIPNRWFPIEHHTGIPLLHYVPSLFRKLLAGTGYDFWTRPANVDFLGGRTIAKEWPEDRPPTIKYSGVMLGPFSSNIIITRS